ncbi:1583_t:CDS:2, partial [Ambispora leptoticha]
MSSEHEQRITELEKCILIAQVLLGEEPMVDYRPSFMRELELDAFFQNHRMALEQHLPPEMR